MTNAVAAIALTYRGTDVQEAFGDSAYMFLELVDGWLEPSTVRGADIIVPARTGRLAGSRVRDVRRVVLEGVVAGATSPQGTGETSFQAKAAALVALFDPTISGALVGTPRGGAARTLNSTRTLSVVWDTITPEYARVNIELESIAPDWT